MDSARLWGAAEALRETIGVILSPEELRHCNVFGAILVWRRAASARITSSS